jgi:hypothetical protein
MPTTWRPVVLHGYIIQRLDGTYYAKLSVTKFLLGQNETLIHKDHIIINKVPTDHNMLKGRLNIAAATRNVPTPLKYI